MLHSNPVGFTSQAKFEAPLEYWPIVSRSEDPDDVGGRIVVGMTMDGMFSDTTYVAMTKVIEAK